jgi:hypothetical protein
LFNRPVCGFVRSRKKREANNSRHSPVEGQARHLYGALGGMNASAVLLEGEKKRMKSSEVETKWGRFRSPDSAASSAIRVFPLRLGHILYLSFFAGQDLKRKRNLYSGQPETKVCP